MLLLVFMVHTTWYDMFSLSFISFFHDNNVNIDAQLISKYWLYSETYEVD